MVRILGNRNLTDAEVFTFLFRFKVHNTGEKEIV